MTRSTLFAFLCLSVAAATALAASGTDAVPNPVPADEAKRLAWPEGSLLLMNDARRAVGYHPWFSELPNHSYFFGYRADTMDDVNRLVELLGRVKGSRPAVEISPLAGDDTGADKKHGPIAAQLWVNSQPLLDRWFDSLTPAGRVKFNATERPVAPPPVLTIYAGHPAIDLAKLVVPDQVTLASGVSVRDRQDAGRDEALAKRVATAEQFVAERAREREKAKPAK